MNLDCDDKKEPPGVPFSSGSYLVSLPGGKEKNEELWLPI
jgi:hypothetical protein